MLTRTALSRFRSLQPSHGAITVSRQLVRGAASTVGTVAVRHCSTTGSNWRHRPALHRGGGGGGGASRRRGSSAGQVSHSATSTGIQMMMSPASGVLSTASRTQSGSVAVQAEGGSQKRFVSDEVLLAILEGRTILETTVKKKATAAGASSAATKHRSGGGGGNKNRTPLGKAVPCPYCDKVFDPTDTTRSVKDHLRAAHWEQHNQKSSVSHAGAEGVDQDAGRFVCYHCRTQYTDFGQFFYHLGPHFNCTSAGVPSTTTSAPKPRATAPTLQAVDYEESVAPLGRYFVCPLTHPEAAAKEAASNATSSEFAKKMLQEGKGPSDGVFGPDATRAEIKAYLAEKFVGEATPAQPEDKSAIPPPRVTCSCCSSEFYSVKSFVDHFDFDKCYLPCKRLGREVESPFSNHVFTADQTPAQVYNHILHKHWQANPFQPRATSFKCPSCLQGFKSFDKLMDHLDADWQCGADFEALDPNARKGKAPEVMPHDLRCPYGAPSSVPDHATIQRDFKKGTPAKDYWDYFVKYHWKEDPAKPRSEPFYCVCGLGYYDFDEYRRHLKWPHKAMCLRPNYLPANWTGPYKAELLPMEQRMKHLVFEAETKEAELAEQHAVNREYAMSEWEKEDQKFAEELAVGAGKLQPGDPKAAFKPPVAKAPVHPRKQASPLPVVTSKKPLVGGTGKQSDRGSEEKEKPDDKKTKKKKARLGRFT